jgi:hypothetical protein
MGSAANYFGLSATFVPTPLFSAIGSQSRIFSEEQAMTDSKALPRYKGELCPVTCRLRPHAENYHPGYLA